MSIDQAIRTAIEYENKIRDVYRDAAERATNAVGRRVFRLLAEEEQHHVDYLEARLAEWERDGRLRLEDIESIVPPTESIEAAAGRLAEKLGGGDVRAEAEMLARAREVEKETGDFYKRMVAELDGDEREFFRRFVEIEEGHLAIVDAELDAVRRAGFWFDMPEFDLESA